jgi:hypothetical protein
MKTIIFEIFRVHNTPNGTVVLSIFSVFYYGKMVVRYYYQFFSVPYYGKNGNLLDVYYLEKFPHCRGYIKRLNIIL